MGFEVEEVVILRNIHVIRYGVHEYGNCRVCVCSLARIEVKYFNVTFRKK